MVQREGSKPKTAKGRREMDKRAPKEVSAPAKLGMCCSAAGALCAQCPPSFADPPVPLRN